VEPSQHRSRGCIGASWGAAGGHYYYWRAGGEATGHYCLAVVCRLALHIYPTLLHIVLPARYSGA